MPLLPFGVSKKMRQMLSKHQAKAVVDSAFGQSSSPFLAKSCSQVDPAGTAAELGMKMILAQFSWMREPMACKDVGGRRLL